ncbi:hypothetical protein [Saccharopolyspora phatthalungensis]|uniref:Uncharacterized protein n=1 Tax=Saccharopolyspora phatthalungensis TaxID=664693 RepID=A0A840Q0X2_9PSEU|nr:hypothetical protein [Saccharopolyspora phatthalungensis]MBB5153181.1 hypothetical protein [Saccharopolyspora phatthalungensis]
MNQRMSDEVTQMLMGALRTGMERYARQHGLPTGLYWRSSLRSGVFLTGHVGAEFTEDQVSEALQKWADHLGLCKDEDPMVGSASYSGAAGGISIEVWGVTDRDRWDQEWGDGRSR